MVENFFVRIFSLLVLILLYNSSCVGSKSASLQGLAESKQALEKLNSYGGLADASNVYLVKFLNTHYGYLRNDLESWANTGAVLERGLIDFWKLPRANVRKSSGILKNLADELRALPDEDESLILIYFSSHQEANGDIIVPESDVNERVADLAKVLSLKKKAQILLIYDTCYALYGKGVFPQADRYAYLYTAGTKGKCYDFKLNNRKPTLRSFCKPVKAMIEDGWSMESSGLSPFGFAFLEAHRRWATRLGGFSLDEFMKQCLSINEEFRAIPGMGRYPAFTWQASELWSEKKIQAH